LFHDILKHFELPCVYLVCIEHSYFHTKLFKTYLVLKCRFLTHPSERSNNSGVAVNVRTTYIAYNLLLQALCGSEFSFHLCGLH
jgi:hypothetical protein